MPDHVPPEIEKLRKRSRLATVIQSRNPDVLYPHTTVVRLSEAEATVFACEERMNEANTVLLDERESLYGLLNAQRADNDRLRATQHTNHGTVAEIVEWLRRQRLWWSAAGIERRFGVKKGEDV